MARQEAQQCKKCGQEFEMIQGESDYCSFVCDPDMPDQWPPITREQVNEWVSVDDYLPEAGKHVLIYGPDDMDIAHYTDKVEDSVDVMGYDAGFISMAGFAFPGRSFGHPDYMQPPHGQPTHWMPYPKPPEEDA